MKYFSFLKENADLNMLWTWKIVIMASTWQLEPTILTTMLKASFG